MAKSSPEKLAQALRANLRRRKEGAASKPAEPEVPDPGKGAEKPQKNSA